MLNEDFIMFRLLPRTTRLGPKSALLQRCLGKSYASGGYHLVVKVKHVLFAVVVQHLAGDSVRNGFLLGGYRFRGGRRSYSVNRFHFGVSAR